MFFALLESQMADVIIKSTENMGGERYEKDKIFFRSIDDQCSGIGQ